MALLAGGHREPKKKIDHSTVRFCLSGRFPGMGVLPAWLNIGLGGNHAQGLRYERLPGIFAS